MFETRIIKRSRKGVRGKKGVVLQLRCKWFTYLAQNKDLEFCRYIVLHVLHPYVTSFNMLALKRGIVLPGSKHLGCL